MPLSEARHLLYRQPSERPITQIGGLRRIPHGRGVIARTHKIGPLR